MILELAETKLFLRVDDNTEDSFIQTLIDTAATYLINATGNIFDSTNGLAKLFCLSLISDWYENRQMVGKVSENLRPTVQSLLAQLQNAYPLIKTTAFPDGTVGKNYGTTLNAEGGSKPYTWVIASTDTLPDGLILDRKTGIISGTPTVTGNKIVTVQLTDSSPVPKTTSRQISIGVIT